MIGQNFFSHSDPANHTQSHGSLLFTLFSISFLILSLSSQGTLIGLVFTQPAEKEFRWWMLTDVNLSGS